jgi:predicted  nucleic acid-binding Zn-ribbon protein
MTPEQMALLSEEAVRFIAEGQGALSRDGMRSLAAEVLVLRERTETWKRRVRRAVKGANARTAEQVRGALRNAVNRNALTTATARLAEVERERDAANAGYARLGGRLAGMAARAEQAEAALAVKDARKSDGWYRAYQRALEQAQEHIDALAAKDARIAELEGNADHRFVAELNRAQLQVVELRDALTAREADVRALREALKAARGTMAHYESDCAYCDVGVNPCPVETRIALIDAALTRTAPPEAPRHDPPALHEPRLGYCPKCHQVMEFRHTCPEEKPPDAS